MSTKKLDPYKLPPTARAAYYHSLRVHLQVILWKELAVNSINSTLWGWKLDGSMLHPVMTDIDPAPCKCKLTTRNPCGSNTCSCRKHGLCGDCRGESCRNAKETFYEEATDLDNISELLTFYNFFAAPFLN